MRTRRRFTLYATPSGSRYHRTPACDGLNSYAMWNQREAPVITQAAAHRRRLTPCAVCCPPPLLTVVT